MTINALPSGTIRDLVSSVDGPVNRDVQESVHVSSVPGLRFGSILEVSIYKSPEFICNR
jgi:hypothetical protein